MLALADHPPADEVALLAVPDHLRPAHAAKRPQRGHEVNGFENVGLALGVVAEQELEAGRKVGVQPRVIAEVPESQMSQMHSGKMPGAGRDGELFCGVGLCLCESPVRKFQLCQAAGDCLIIIHGSLRHF